MQQNPSTATAPSTAGDIPLRLKLSWGIGSFGTISFLNIVTALIMVYLTTVLKIDPAVAGFIVFAGRIVDALCDPLMGWITDRTQSRWGRRKPYLLLGAIVCGLALPLVYSAHSFGGAVNPAVIAMITLVVYSLGFTIFNVPYLALPVEITTDRLQRLSIMSYRVVFMMLGALAGNAGAPLLVEKLGQGGDAFQTLGMVGGVVVFVTMLITFVGAPSSPSVAADKPSTAFSIRQQLATIAANKPFCTMILIKVMQFFAIAASASTMAYFVTVVLKQGFDLLSIFGAASTVSIMLSIPFWRWVGKFTTKRRGFMIGVVGEIISILSLLWVTADNAHEFFLARGIFTGFFASAILLNSQAMWLDTIDYDFKLTGLRREGMYTSIYVFIERIGYSLGPLVLGFLLAGLGFDKNLPLQQQPQSAELAVYIGVIWLPIATYIIGFIALMFYRLPETINGKEVN